MNWNKMTFAELQWDLEHICRFNNPNKTLSKAFTSRGTTISDTDIFEIMGNPMQSEQYLHVHAACCVTVIK